MRYSDAFKWNLVIRNRQDTKAGREWFFPEWFLGFFDQKPLLRQKLVKWFLSSKVVFAIYLRPRTFCEALNSDIGGFVWCSRAEFSVHFGFIHIKAMKLNNIQSTKQKCVAVGHVSRMMVCSSDDDA